MPAIRPIATRSMAGLLASLMLLGFANLAASAAEPSPIGAWVGTVADDQRNIVVKLTIKSIDLGSRDGEMRWNAPRDCSLKTEYAGKRAGDYSLNIFSADGGWCDLYRDGTLALQPDKNTIGFTLKDKQGERVTTGRLKRAPP